MGCKNFLGAEEFLDANEFSWGGQEFFVLLKNFGEKLKDLVGFWGKLKNSFGPLRNFSGVLNDFLGKEKKFWGS